MILGFTGTRNGMNFNQYSDFRNYIGDHEITEFHHGDCKGADAEAHDLIREFTNAKIIIHPPEDHLYRAFCLGDEIRELKPYLERNHDIVDETECLYAMPFTNKEVLRSGTWATIRYAKPKQGYIITISWREEIQ